MKKLKLMLPIICIALMVLGRGQLFKNPFKQTEPFDAPSYATMDESGRIYVIDQNEKRVMVINEDGNIALELHGLERSGDGFYQAKEIVTDGRDYMYVLDATKSIYGDTIDSERILKYTLEGKPVETIYSVTNDLRVLKRSLSALTLINGELYFVRLSQGDFSLVRAADGSVVAAYPYENALTMLSGFAVNPRDLSISYTTFQGGLYMATADGHKLVYGTGLDNNLRIPRSPQFDTNGQLYFSDLGTRELYTINDNAEVRTVVGASGENPPVYYRLSVLNSTVVSVSEGVLIARSDSDARLVLEAGISGDMRIIIALIWLTFLTFTAWTLFLLFKLFRIVSAQIDTGPSRTLLSYLIIVPLVSAVILFTVFNNFNTRLEKETLQRMATVARFISQIIDIETVKAIDGPEDYMSDAYVEMREKILHNLDGSSSWNEGLYCMLYKVKDGVIFSCFGMEDETGAVYPYDWPYEDSDEEAIYHTKQMIEYKGLSTSEGRWIFVLAPLLDNKGEVAGLVEVGTDLYTLTEANNKLLMELIFVIAAITMVILLFSTETVLLYNVVKIYQRQMEKSISPYVAQMPVNIIRPLVFIVFFATNMATAFLPIYADSMLVSEQTYLFNLPGEIIIALPIASEVFFTALFSMLGGSIVDRLDIKRSSMLGGALMTVGLALPAFVPNIFGLIAGEAISGSGSGILLLSVNILIAGRPDEEKNEGFASYSGALLSGLNCGVVVGASLADFIGYRYVFLAAALSMTVCFFVIAAYVKDERYLVQHVSPDEKISGLTFILKPRVLSFLLAVMAPYLICGYFLIYLFPIEGVRLGLSEVNIGHIFLLNGLIVIYMGPLITKIILARMRRQTALVVSTLIYAAALTLYAVLPSVLTLLLAVALLGIADSFGFPIQSIYYTDLPEFFEYGEKKAMGIFSLVENAAQTMGPFVFGVVLLYGGLFAVVSVLLVLCGIFIVTNLFMGKRGKLHEPVS